MLKVHLLEQSNPIEYENIINCYTKGNLYCVYFEDDKGDNKVHKYPLMNIFRVEEVYK